ncbi:replication initiator protein A [Deinococcus sp. QL22]|uniref:replication initiator protein A n=1 Tax=Deinococcus sp. QL22 TaxID=2939437 RepID=UPI00201810A9|nr:replication initiator protein A [Deinococcus sp. QL22]UQN08357.1 replication initiator protein A [Deinococcus sp. QL22]
MPERKPRRSAGTPPSVPDITSGYDELNLGRLALISGQKTVPGTLRRWQKQVTTPDGRPVIITCTVPDDQVVPHGLDNDFMVGLVNLCFEAGLPDGPFSVSAYGLLKASGFSDSAQYYRSLEESLVRLNKASYTIDEGWFVQGPHGWTTQSFAQVSYLSYSRSRTGVQGTSVVTVQLAPPVMESLRAGYIKPLDLNFYRGLSQPLVRAVYRQLDALHFDESTADGLVRELTAPLMAWGNRLGLLSDRPDNVVRTLTPAHEELQAKGYVAAVEITGRGRDKVVRYVFGPPPQGEHPGLAALLTDRGVKQGVAVRLSTVFPERIEEAARRFDHYLKVSQRPVGNPGGLLVAMVQRPEDFSELPGYRNQSGAEARAPVKRAGQRTARQGADENEADLAQEDVRLAALSGTDLVDWMLRQLSVLGILKHFTVPERARLADVVLAGNLDGRHLVRAATRAMVGGAPAIGAVVQDVRAHL